MCCWMCDQPVDEQDVGRLERAQRRSRCVRYVLSKLCSKQSPTLSTESCWWAVGDVLRLYRVLSGFKLEVECCVGSGPPPRTCSNDPEAWLLSVSFLAEATSRSFVLIKLVLKGSSSQIRLQEYTLRESVCAASGRYKTPAILIKSGSGQVHDKYYQETPHPLSHHADSAPHQNNTDPQYHVYITKTWNEDTEKQLIRTATA